MWNNFCFQKISMNTISSETCKYSIFFATKKNITINTTFVVVWFSIPELCVCLKSVHQISRMKIWRKMFQRNPISLEKNLNLQTSQSATISRVLPAKHKQVFRGRERESESENVRAGKYKMKKKRVINTVSSAAVCYSRWRDYVRSVGKNVINSGNVCALHRFA